MNINTLLNEHVRKSSLLQLVFLVIYIYFFYLYVLIYKNITVQKVTNDSTKKNYQACRIRRLSQNEY